MKELHKENYDDEVIRSTGLFLVDFWSESCEECQDIMPEIEKLTEDFADKAAFGKVNIKGNRRLAIREKVMGLPSLVIYKDGEQIASFSKEFEVSQVRAKLEELLGS